MSMAVRASGDLVTVTGQVALDEVGQLVAVGDAEGQAVRCFENIAAVLAPLDATLTDVTQLTCYLLDRRDFEPYLRARARYFPTDPPATCTVVVAELLAEGCLLEIQAIAVVAP